MNKGNKGYSYNDMQEKGTGSYKDQANCKIVTYPFEKYQIKTQLSPTNEFIGVVEVKINKEFLSHKQKTIAQGFIDSNEDYPE